MSSQERKFMEAAIAAARRSRVDSTGMVPRVGAVAVVGDRIIGEAYREEFEPGQHAEYVLLEKHLPNDSLVNATVYTTLEPCTKRGEGKIPCVERLVNRKVRRVVIGMLDPNPIVRGLGFRKLRLANIRTEVFPHELMSAVEDLNRDFVRTMENNPVHQATQEIAALAARANHALQRTAVSGGLARCLDTLRSIQSGRIPIPGKEAGYFHRWLDVAQSSHGVERVKAYIRVPAFDPVELLTKNWYGEFYARIRELVSSGRLSIRYIFLLATNEPAGGTLDFLNSFKDFAEEIRLVNQKGDHLAPEQLRPSIVLFQTRRTAFTHDRSDNAILIEADEWIFEDDYKRLEMRFATVELASSVFFTRDPASDGRET